MRQNVATTLAKDVAHRRPKLRWNASLGKHRTMKRSFLRCSDSFKRSTWTIQRSGTSVTTEYQLDDGKPRTNITKHKDLESAKLDVERKTKRKMSEGYSEKPQSIRHDVLGLIRHIVRINPELDEYQTKVELDGRKVEMLLYSDKSLGIQETIEHANTFVKRFDVFRKKLDRYLGKEVLKGINRWRESRIPLEPSQLCELLPIAGVNFHADKSLSIDFRPPVRLLDYHFITIWGNLSGEFSDYSIEG